MNFKSQSDLREVAIVNLLRRLQEEIIKTFITKNNLYNKAFHIYEQTRFDEMTGKEITIFSIQEIPISIQQLNIPNQQEISLLPKKYNFKERIRILFKGE